MIVDSGLLFGGHPVEFTAWYGELKPEEAPTSFTVSDAYR